MRHIASGVVDPGERARVAMPIVCVRGAAQRAACRKTCVISGHAAADVLVLEQREMRIDLTRDLRVRAIFSKHVQQPLQKPAHVTTR